MKYLAPIPKQFVDHNGLPLSNGAVHVYISGDTQYANVYQYADGEELMPNPAKLDSNGAWVGFVTAGIPLDYVVEDKDGNVQFEYEKVVAGGGGGGDVAEIGGKKYPVTKIGSQTWLTENLDLIFPGVSLNPGGEPTTPAAFNQNLTSRCAYGLLYNWFAVNLLQTNKEELIPGWRVPTKQDFEDLFSNVGGLNNTKKLCYTPWNGGTNEYGFSLMPCGLYNAGSFTGAGSDAILWSSTQYNANEAYFYLMQTNVPSFSYYYKKQGYAIRLIKDD